MKKLFITLLSVAAITSTVAITPVLADSTAPKESRWDGFYGSFIGGYGWAGDQNHFNNSNGFVTSLGKVDGGLFGLGAGWNHTKDQFLFGVEADGSATNFNASLNNCLGRRLNRGCSAAVDSLITVRGRVGMTFGDENQFLAFAAGGLALSEVTLSTFPGGGGPTSTDTRWQTGWTAGGGLEMFWPGNKWLSSRIEYLYVDVPTDTFKAASTPTRRIGFGAGMHVVRMTVSLHLY